MTELLSEAPPRLKARLAGLFQLLEAAAVSRQNDLGLGMFVVTRDPAATATNILANEYLYQFGFACSLIAVGVNLARALLSVRPHGYVLVPPTGGGNGGGLRVPWRKVASMTVELVQPSSFRRGFVLRLVGPGTIALSYLELCSSRSY